MADRTKQRIYARFDEATCIHKLLEYLTNVQNNIPMEFSKRGIVIHQGNDYVPQKKDVKNRKKFADTPILNVATIRADDLSEYYYDGSDGETYTVILDGGRLIDSMPTIKTKNYLVLYINREDSRIRYSIDGQGENIIQPLVGTENDAPEEYDFTTSSTIVRVCVDAFNTFADAVRTEKVPVTVRVFAEGVSFNIKSYGHADGRSFPFGKCEVIQHEFNVSSDFFALLYNKITKIADSRSVLKISSQKNDDDKHILRLNLKIGTCGDLLIYVDEKSKADK